MPELDFEPCLQAAANITPETAMKNPKIVNALMQYENETRHTIMGKMIPDQTAQRKEFIHCKRTLKQFQQYLYVEHDILVNQPFDLVSALYAVYIFKLNANTLTDATKENPANIEKEDKSDKQVLIYIISLSFIFNHYHYNNDNHYHSSIIIQFMF